MIRFLTTRRGRHTVHEYLAGAGRAYRSEIQSLTYERAAGARSRRAMGAGLYVFADIERLDQPTCIAARALWASLQSEPHRSRTLNLPGRTMKRLELLRALHDEGLNDFRAWPITEPAPRDVRFPVFIRAADDHLGPRGGLLPDRSALEEALAHARSSPRACSLICCEWAGWRRPDGFYRKYSCFVVGDRIIPRHLFFGRHWVVKMAGSVTAEQLAEEQRFLRDNPHEDLLCRVCQIAGVGYGRIDYDTRPDGSLAVWEINTNPVIVPLGMDPASPRWNVNVERAGLVLEALSALDPKPAAALPPPLHERVQVTLMRRSQPWHAPRLEAAVWRALRTVGASAARRLLEREPAADRRIPRQARKAVTGLRIVASDPERKPLGTILREAAWFTWRERDAPFYYFALSLYQQSAGDVAAYVGSRRSHAIQRHLVAPHGESEAIRDKVIFSQRLAARGLPQPALLATVNDADVALDGRRSTLTGPQDLARLLERLCTRSLSGAVFLKPATAMRGTACYRFEPGAGRLAALVWDALRDARFIVQEAIEQHDALKAVYPNAVNTIRVHTHRRGDEVTVLSALLRVGRGGMMIDNLHAGGIYVPIDLETRRLQPPGRERFWQGAGTFPKHPDTGYAFSELEVPMFDRIVGVTREAALAFGDPFLGWDVAVTAKGPVIIEANVGFSLNLAQVAVGGFRADPRFAEAFADYL